MEKISAVYKITNTVTGDFYIGSSKNVKKRWAAHKWPSRWKQYPDNPLYKDMQKFGVNSFVFQVIEEVEPGSLKEKEQQFIETLNPAYNSCNANGLNIERKKETDKEYKKQLCFYNGETLTLNALSIRFLRAGIPHPTIEAKKYIKNNNPIEFYDVYP